MRTFLLIPVLLLLGACNNDKLQTKPVADANTFDLNLRPGVWTITIPPGFTIEDSAAYVERLKVTPYQDPAPGSFNASMIYVYDSAGLGDTIYHSLSLSRYGAYDSTAFKKAVQISVKYNPGDFNLDTSFQHLVVNRLDSIMIDKQKFIVEHYVVRRGRDTVIFRSYYALRNGQMIMADLHYYESDTLGKKLVGAIEGSRFRE